MIFSQSVGREKEGGEFPLAVCEGNAIGSWNP